MTHDPLALMLTVGLLEAFLLGIVAHRLRLPPIAGYLLAGILMGPHIPGIEADAGLALELADLGLISCFLVLACNFLSVCISAFNGSQRLVQPGKSASWC